jgi:regulator of RNase E activity RraA
MNTIISTPDLSDEFDQKVAIVEPLFKHYGELKQGYGQIMTVDCFEDNSLVAEQVKSPGEGRVLIIDGKGSLRCSLLGDQLAAAALDNEHLSDPLPSIIRTRPSPGDLTCSATNELSSKQSTVII